MESLWIQDCHQQEQDARDSQEDPQSPSQWTSRTRDHLPQDHRIILLAVNEEGHPRIHLNMQDLSEMRAKIWRSTPQPHQEDHSPILSS